MALSHATDLAIGQPVEYALRSCVLAMRIGRALSLDDATMRQVFHHALLRYIGCHAETDAMAALLGDEIAFRRAVSTLDMGDPADLLPALVRALVQAQAGQPLPSMVWNVVTGFAQSRGFTLAGFQAHCEAAQALARHLGFDGDVVRNLGQFQERWDGKGMPTGLKGEAIARAVRVVVVAHDAVILDEAQGRTATLAAVKKRRGGLYDPQVADAFVRHADALMKDLATSSSWEQVLALEPAPHARYDDEQLEEACRAMADFVDIKSPYTLGHSRAIATLVHTAGRLRGLPPPEVTALRRAALLHDIGQAGVSSGVFAKAGPLSDAEREKVRLHPYHAERILAGPAAFARVVPIVSHHHERNDGSGYHRGARVDALTTQQKILAAAEVYQALIEARPWRAAWTTAQAAAHLRAEVKDGRLDGDAVAAVLEAAGHRVPIVRKDRVAGLTAREIDVLRLVARGQTMQQIADALGIAKKTADNHIQNLYGKIGVKTRVAAALFAVDAGLME